MKTFCAFALASLILSACEPPKGGAGDRRVLDLDAEPRLQRAVLNAVDEIPFDWRENHGQPGRYVFAMDGPIVTKFDTTSGRLWLLIVVPARGDKQAWAYWKEVVKE